MPFYVQLGDVPRKRHIQFRDNGTLLTEEVMGLEGFTGNESILYHLHSPCRVKELGPFEPIEREEWVPEQHAHRHFKTYGIDAEGEKAVKIRIKGLNPKHTLAKQVPIESFEMPNVKNDSVPLGNRAFIERTGLYDAEQFIRAFTGSCELFEKTISIDTSLIKVSV